MHTKCITTPNWVFWGGRHVRDWWPSVLRHVPFIVVAENLCSCPARRLLHTGILVKLWRARSLQNGGLVLCKNVSAKFGFDTAENEPSKICPLSGSSRHHPRIIRASSAKPQLRRSARLRTFGDTCGFSSGVRGRAGASLEKWTCYPLCLLPG